MEAELKTVRLGFILFGLAILAIFMFAQSSSIVHAGGERVLPNAGQQGAESDGPLATLAPARFATAVTYASGGLYGVWVAAGDLNGDGFPDVVEVDSCPSSGSCSNSEISVFLGKSNGTLEAGTTYDSGGVAGAGVAIGDVNGDGHPDLVIANECESSSNCNNGLISVLLGNGDGTFKSAVTYNAGYVPVAIALGDMNGDGHLDVVVANQSQCASCSKGGVSVLLNNGNGTFQAPVIYSSGGVSATSVALGDMNKDGHLDVVMTNQFQCQSCGNGDVSILLGKGDGTLGAATTYSSGGYSALSVAIGDLDGDGKPDVVATNLCIKSSSCTDGVVEILLGNGDGTFRIDGTYDSGAYSANSVAIADVNGDGAPDLLVANTCKASSKCSLGGVSVLLGNGDGTFQSAVTHSSGGVDATSISVVDVNHDGRADVLAANHCASNLDCTGTVAVLRNTSSDKTTTKLTSAPNPSSINQTVTFTATVTSSLAVPDGQVIKFSLGKRLLGTGVTVNGVATFSTSFSKANTYTIKASYPGDNFHAASSGTVKQVVSP